jgi:uncharacterized protein (AIM24 family)
MSKVAITGNASGTGVFTIASPDSSTDRTLTLPDAGGTVFVSGQALSATTGSFSGDVTLGSSVLATPSGSAPSYTCRAWVNFNGTGTVAIRASGNVSSITDNGTGDYTVNFTTAMPDTNFAVSGSASPAGTSSGLTNVHLNTTSPLATTSVRIAVSATGNVDRAFVTVLIVR